MKRRITPWVVRLLRLGKGARILAALAAWLAALPAFAAITCTGGGVTTEMPVPTTLSVPRDTNVAVGTLLTSWVTMPARTGAFTCTTTANSWQRVYARNQSGMSSAGIRVPGPPAVNTNANVAASGVPGIGIAVIYQPFIASWQRTEVLAFPNWSKNFADSNANGTRAVGGQLWVALVKTAGAVSAGTINAVELATISPFNAGNPADGTWTPDRYTLPAVTVQLGACQVPSSITVPLGVEKLGNFTGHGSTGSWADFEVPVSGCPAYLGAVLYGFNPVSGFPADVGDRVRGVINIQAGGATGLGIQLWDVDWATYTPAYPALLQARSFAPGAETFAIPMRARMYQTGDRVGPGEVRGQAQIMMSYR